MSKLLTAFDFYGNGGNEIHAYYTRAHFQTNGLHFVFAVTDVSLLVDRLKLG